MLRLIGRLKNFVVSLARDERIPARDKKLLAALCAYLAMPFDLIPDFIPVLGYADDMIVAVVILDYVFNVVPEPIILEHFPWPPRRYHAIRRWTRIISWLIPGFIRRRLWKQVERSGGQP